MAEVVDSIIAELIARDNGYIATFDKATAAHGRFKESVTALKAQTFDLSAEGQKYKAGADKIAQAEEQVTQRTKQTRKARADAALASDATIVASAKKTADAQIAEAQRSARLSAVAQRAVDRAAAGVPRGTGANFGAAVPKVAVTPIVGPDLNAPLAVETAEAAEINHLLADQGVLQAKLTAARGIDRDIIRDQLTELRLINTLKRAGLTDEEATIKAEATLAAIEAERVATAGRLASVNARNAAERFAEGAGLQRTGGSSAAIAGLAAAAAVGGAIAAVSSSVDYAKQLAEVSKQLGLTTTQLQVYQRAAADVNVSSTKLQSGFGQLAAYLGRAQEGDKQAAKTFDTLGISIKGVGTAGDILPTLIQRLSSIEDPAKRAAIETRLFGEAGRDLDPLLSGGIDKVNDLAASMQAAGSVLSPSDIADLQKAGVVLGNVKQQLEVDVAHVVAGNASAIESLATAFGHLITNMGGAARILQDEGLQALIFGHNHGDVVAASNPGTYLTQVRLPALAQAKKEYQDAVAGGDDRSPAAISQALKFGQDVPTSKDAAAAKLRTEIALTKAATQRLLESRGPSQGPAQAGKVGDLSKLFAPNGPKGKSAETLENERLAREKQFNDQLSQSQEDQLRAQEALTADVNKQAEIESDIADRALARRLQDIEDQKQRNINNGADPKLEAARAAQLAAAAKLATQEEKAVIAQQAKIKIDDAATALATTQLQIEQGLLSSRLALADTAKERLAIELQLLENAKEQKEKELKGQLNDLTTQGVGADDDRVKALQAQIANLPKQLAADQSVATKQNQGPGAQYLRDLPNTANQLNEAFQNVAVDGLKSVTDGLTDAITGVHSLGDAFKLVSKQIIADLVRIAVEQAIVAPIAGALFGGTGGASGILAGIIGHRAAGGGVVAGQPYVVGEHRPEIFIPSVSGAIAPDARAAMGGSQTTIVHQSFHLDARYGITTPELIGYVNDTANRAAAGAGAASYKASQASAPGRLQKLQNLGT